MSSYEAALFLHVLGAVLFFSGMAVAGAGYLAAARRERPSEIALLLGMTRAGVLLVVAGTILILAFGLWLVDLTGYSYGDGWVSAALALFVVTSVLGALGGRRPKEARLLAARLAREGDASDPTLQRLLHDRAARWMNYGAALAALAILALMVFKP